jgi:hypothetical protein
LNKSNVRVFIYFKMLVIIIFDGLLFDSGLRRYIFI